jgi:predicted acyl esterase
LRGFHKSKEAATLAHPVMFSDQEAQDYYDAIEWAAEQEWCNGKVGLLGVSYLAISQYKVAALRPPHLCAICLWEGFTDMYRDTARPGGIAETQFFKAWFTQLKSFMSEDLPLEILANETRNSEFYLGKTCDLKRIDVPALVVMSYSDQGLHTQGSMNDFREVLNSNRMVVRNVPVYERNPLWTDDGRNGGQYNKDESGAMIRIGYKSKEEPARWTPEDSVEDHKKMLDYILF